MFFLYLLCNQNCMLLDGEICVVQSVSKLGHEESKGNILSGQPTAACTIITHVGGLFRNCVETVKVSVHSVRA